MPAIYIYASAGESCAGIGGPTGKRIETRASIIDLWHEARSVLEKAGAEVVIVDFPVVTNYEGTPNFVTRGILPADYLHHEITDLSVWAWDDFLKTNADPTLNSLAAVDGSQIFPQPDGSLADRYKGFEGDIADYPAHARTNPRDDFLDIPTLSEGLHRLEKTLRIIRLRQISHGAMVFGSPMAILPSATLAFRRSPSQWARWQTFICLSV